MAKQDNSKHNNQDSGSPAPSQRGRGRFASIFARRDADDVGNLDNGRARFWWCLALATAALWWLGAAVGDFLLERWWLRSAQGAPGGPNVSPSTWGVDFGAAHWRIEAFRWGGTLAGAILCGGWAWRQSHLAVENARESEASLGLLWSTDEAARGASGESQTQQTGRWIPLEDKLGLDRFRPAALRAGIGACALIGASLGGRAWPLWLDFWAARDAGSPSGPRDPWLGQDLSFYLFRLPTLDFFWRLALLAHVLAILLCLGIYLYEDSLQVGRRLWASRRALRHIGILFALALAWKAAGAALYPFEMLAARSPDWSGPHAIDWLWRRPLSVLAALATLVCAVWCVREANRNQPQAVLKWALAPFAISWLALHALPALQSSRMTREQAAQDDAPFAQAQLQWTQRALGFPQAEPPTLAAASTLDVDRREQALRSVSERDMALWVGSGAELSSLSAEPRASTWAGAREAPRLTWHQAAAAKFQPRTWDEKHIDTPAQLVLRRFSVEPLEADASARFSPNHTLPVNTRSTRLKLQDERRFSLLVGTDAADSPGLLHDSEVAAAIATGVDIEQQHLPDPLSVSASNSGVRSGRTPFSFFDSSMSGQTSGILGLPMYHALPLFRILDKDARVGGVALDAPWKKWLAAWRFGSLSLLRSPRVDEDAHLAWRLDATQRCRKLAPFLSWPDAPRPAVDESGQLFWLLDGYTLSAAFPLARALDTRASFATSENLSRALPEIKSGSDVEMKARRSFIENMIRRQEVLSRVSQNLDGFNWARASVVAVVDASSGAVSLFPMHADDVILSHYRRALPELWSRPQDLPRFARAALRLPPHLASLQSAAWASVAAPDASPGASASTWQATSCFFVPTAQGVRTGILLHSTSPKPAQSTSKQDAAPSTWVASVAPALGTEKRAAWQAHRFEPGSGIDWNRADALLPAASSASGHWLVRQRPPASEANIEQQSLPEPAKTTSTPNLTPSSLPNTQGWQRANALWQQAKQAQKRGDRRNYEILARQLEQLLRQNAQSQP